MRGNGGSHSRLPSDKNRLFHNISDFYSIILPLFLQNKNQARRLKNLKFKIIKIYLILQLDAEFIGNQMKPFFVTVNFMRQHHHLLEVIICFLGVSINRNLKISKVFFQLFEVLLSYDFFSGGKTSISF